jgi:hypothetical protein
MGDVCDTDGFCFVPPKNPDPSRCLDPNDAFQIVGADANVNASSIAPETAAPPVTAKAGEVINLSLYTNRLGVKVDYSWVVDVQPEGSKDTVRNPAGSATCGDAYECPPDGANPVLVPSTPGEYILSLMADLAEPDTIEPTVKHAQTTLKVTVTPASGSSGCAIAGHRPVSLFVILGLALVTFWRRRR